MKKLYFNGKISLGKLLFTISLTLLLYGQGSGQTSADINNKTKTDSLEAILLTAREDINKIKILNQLCYEYAGKNPGKALQQGKEALILGKKLLSLKKAGKKVVIKKEISTSLTNIGHVYIYQGNFNKSIENFKSSIKISEELDDKTGISTCLNHLGEVHRMLGNYKKSIDYHHQSLKIFDEFALMPDKASKRYGERGKSASFHNIGIIYEIQGNHEKAMDCYFRSLKIDEAMNNKPGIAASMGGIGGINHLLGNYPKAFEYYHKSLKIKKEIGDKYGIARSLGNIGNIYFEQGNYEKVIEYDLQSFEIFQELGDKQGIAKNLANIGELYSVTGDHKKAIEYLYNGLEIAKEIGAKILIKNAHEVLAETYSQMGEHPPTPLDRGEYYKKAFEHHKLYAAIKDTLFNAEKSEAIGMIKAEYEIEKKMDKEQRLQQELEKIAAEKLNRRNNMQYFAIV